MFARAISTAIKLCEVRTSRWRTVFIILFMDKELESAIQGTSLHTAKDFTWDVVHSFERCDSCAVVVLLGLYYYYWFRSWRRKRSNLKVRVRCKRRDHKMRISRTWAYVLDTLFDRWRQQKPDIYKWKRVAETIKWKSNTWNFCSIFVANHINLLI